MNNKSKAFCPAPPGKFLKEKLEEYGWSQVEFSEIIGRPIQAINEIIAGKKSITPETAILLANAFDGSPQEWLSLEANYRLSLLSPEQQKADLVSRKAKLYSKAPVKELIKRNWIQTSNDIEQLENEVLNFLGISDLDSTPQIMANFRRTDAATIDMPSIKAWLRKTEIESSKKTCSSFESTKLNRNISNLISLSANEHTISIVPQRLCELGIRLVFVRHLPKTRVDGTAFWLDDKSPVIALSLRYDRIDNFWFTLMHEVAHILDGYQKTPLHVDDTNAKPQNETETEKKANQTAKNWLIPQKDYNTFVEKNNRYFSRRVILEFANNLGIHPGIIVGRLQFEGLIPYTNLRNLLGKIRPIFAEMIVQ